MTTLAQALGHGPDARLVILHQDDVGMCRGANTAYTELSRRGGITSGAVMVPCPWFPDIAAVAAADPELDLGVHLTLTSEWAGYRWRPVSSEGHALTDSQGYFPRNVPELRARIEPVAVEAELRAQIELALAAGIRPTHLDTHMGACLVPELRALYLQLGREYRLPVLLPRDFDSYVGVLKLGERPRDDESDYGRMLAITGQPQIDTFRMSPWVASAEAAAAYRKLITSVRPGVTFVALHCNAPGDIEGIDPNRAHCRTDEYALFRSPTPARWLADAHIVPIGMRVIRDLLYPA